MNVQCPSCGSWRLVEFAKPEERNSICGDCDYSSRMVMLSPAQSIQTANGTARLVKTEEEDEDGNWNDNYWTKEGYYVIHDGARHHVYKVGNEVI